MIPPRTPPHGGDAPAHAGAAARVGQRAWPDYSFEGPPGWQNGDLNAQNSFYREGDTVPFRAVLTNLASGSHTLVIQYDTTQSGKHAYDYLTRFDRTVTGANPCDGVASCSGAGSNSGAIPLSDNPTPPSLALVTAANRYFTIWNGTITNVSLGGATDVAGEQQSMSIVFTNSDPTVVIAWGGHVADEITWPHATAAGSINGSPCHMRVISLDGSGGNQDRSMKANAVPAAPPTFTTDVESSGDSPAYVGSIQPGGSVTDNAVLSGDNGPVSGNVSFFACYAADGAPDCTTGGTLVAQDVAVGSLGTAGSGTFTPDQSSGTYCFRAEYTPDSEAFYSPATETNGTIESAGNHGECFTVVSETTLLPSDVATVITGSNGQPAGDSATVGSTVHDVATVSGTEAGRTPTGSVTFALYNGTACSGDASSETVSLDANGSAPSSDTTVASGGLSYRVHYGGSDVYAASDGLCENLSSSTPPPPTPTPTPSTPATSAPPAIDLAIVKLVTPNPATLGNAVTWTETVTNNGPDGATGVKLADPLPAGTSYVSVQTTQGSCTGGPVVNCDLGSLAAGASATIAIVTKTLTIGSLTNTATVVGNEAETNTANNTASATLTVKGVFKPPAVKPKVYCAAITVVPRTIFVGRQALVTMVVKRQGKPVAGVRVRIKGSTLAMVTKRSNGKGLVKVRVTPKRAGIVSFRPVAPKVCQIARSGVTGVFTPPVTG